MEQSTIWWLAAGIVVAAELLTGSFYLLMLALGLAAAAIAAHLGFEVRFGCAVLTAADLTGDEEEVTAANGGGIAVLFVKRMAVCGENGFRLGHGGPFEHAMSFRPADRVGEMPLGCGAKISYTMRMLV